MTRQFFVISLMPSFIVVLTNNTQQASIIEFCELAELATLSSSFADHLGVFKYLVKIYDCLCQEKTAARKNAFKKLKALKEEKKPDPLAVQEAQKAADDLDAQCAKLNIKQIKINLVVGPPAQALP